MSTLHWRLAGPVLLGWLILIALDINQFHMNTSQVFPAVLAWIICVLLSMRWSAIVSLYVAICGLLIFSQVIQKSGVQPHTLVGDSSTSNWPWISTLHHNIFDSLQNFPGIGAQLIPGLVIGDDSRMSDSVSYAMKQASLSHITAVSGANCVIVVTVISVLMASLGANRWVRVICSCGFIFLYACIVGGSPSVVRASVMAGVALVATLIGRPASGVSLLAAAVFGILVFTPAIADDYGFILSVAATAALILLVRPLARQFSHWMPEFWANIIAIPLAAQLVCQPIIILLTPHISTYGVPANLLVMPATTLATLCGVLACIVIIVVPVSAPIVLWSVWVPAQWIAHTAVFFTNLPNASLSWISGPSGALLWAVISALFCLSVINPVVVVRRTATWVLLLSLGVICSISLISSFYTTLTRPSQWNIAACDVGQGDAFVLRSRDHYALIDTGRYPDKIANCLQNLGITRFDFILLTHYDQDHIAGLPAVMGMADQFIVGRSTDGREQQITKQLSDLGKTYSYGSAGMAGSLGDMNWEILWPDTRHPRMQEGNPGSLVLYAKFGSRDALFTGDLDATSQQALLTSIPLPQIDVVKVSHHGSADQFSKFYEQIHAQFGLISVGEENRYGHPRSTTLNMLRLTKTIVERTDQDGLILVDMQEKSVSVWKEH